MSYQKNVRELATVAHTCNSSTQEAEAEGLSLSLAWAA
jgi:hypothetical protein